MAAQPPPLSELCVIIGTQTSQHSGHNDSRTQAITSQVTDHIFNPEVLSVITKNNIKIMSQDKMKDPSQRRRKLSTMTENKISTVTPIPWAILSNLTIFCYPNKLRFTETPSDPSIEYQAFTDEYGLRFYVTCLCLPTSYHVHIDPVDNNILIDAIDKDQIEKVSNGELFYAEQKFCFFSVHRYHLLMKDLLQRLLLCLNTKLSTQHVAVMKLVFILSNIIIPPGGGLDISFTYIGRIFTVPSQIVPGFSDMSPLWLPFDYFTRDVILNIVTVILAENQVVFVSSDQATRFLVMESFLAYIYPFDWIYPYIPNLFPQLYDLLGAIGMFMFGTDRSSLEELYAVDYIVVIDIDEGVVNYGAAVKVPELPRSLRNEFKSTLPLSKLHFESSALTRVYSSDEDFEVERGQFKTKLNLTIFLAFQTLFTRLYTGIIDFNKIMLSRRGSHVHSTLPRENGVDKVLKNILESSSLVSVLLNKCDNVYLKKESVTTLKLVSTRSVAEVHEDILKRIEQKGCFKLTQFASKNKDMIDKAISEGENSNKDLSSLLYLQGVLFLEKDELIQAFCSFNKIFEVNIDSFPSVEVFTILSKTDFESPMFEELKSCAFMKQSMWVPLLVDPHAVKSNYKKIVLSGLDQRSFTQIDFPDILMQLGVTRNHNTAKDLFKTLATNDKIVPGKCFETFYDIWKEINRELDEIYVLGTGRSSREPFVKKSEKMDLDIASKTFVATVYRIIILDEEGNADKVINITNIIEVQVVKNTITIISKILDPITIDNIDNVFNWQVILDELIGAHARLLQTKDYDTLIEARSHILIYESLNRYSNEDANMLTFDSLEPDGPEAVGNSNFYLDSDYTPFLMFRQLMHDGDITDIGKKSNLECRFSPNKTMKETILKLIITSSGLIIASNRCNMYKADLVSYEILETLSLRIEEDDLEGWTLYDMIHANNELWTCTQFRQSRNLHIIDCEMFKIQNVIDLEHSDHIKTMTTDGRLCYISSIDGIVSVWDVLKRQCIKRMCMEGDMVMSCVILSDKVYFSLPNTLKLYDEVEGCIIDEALIEITLLQLTTCQGLLWGIDKSNLQIIRAITFDMKHTPKNDFVSTTPGGWFNNLISFQDRFLILSTRVAELIVYDVRTRLVLHHLYTVHDDIVKAVSVTESGLVITGSGSKDGSVCVWRNLF